MSGSKILPGKLRNILHIIVFLHIISGILLPSMFYVKNKIDLQYFLGGLFYGRLIVILYIIFLMLQVPVMIIGFCCLSPPKSKFLVRLIFVIWVCYSVGFQFYMCVGILSVA